MPGAFSWGVYRIDSVRMAGMGRYATATGSEGSIRHHPRRRAARGSDGSFVRHPLAKLLEEVLDEDEILVSVPPPTLRPIRNHSSSSETSYRFQPPLAANTYLAGILNNVSCPSTRKSPSVATRTATILRFGSTKNSSRPLCAVSQPTPEGARPGRVKGRHSLAT